MSEVNETNRDETATSESYVHLIERPSPPDYAGGWVVGGDTPFEGLMILKAHRPTWLVRTVTPWLLPVKWFSGYFVDRGFPSQKWIET